MVGLIRCLCVGVLISKELIVHSHIFDHMYIQLRSAQNSTCRLAAADFAQSRYCVRRSESVASFVLLKSVSENAGPFYGRVLRTHKTKRSM